MSGFNFERRSDHCLLKFTPQLAEMTWADVESATEKVTQLVHDDPSHTVLVDLSALQSMPAGLVTSLVRTWKGMDERSRRLAVVSSNDTVRNELEQTGLTSLWTLASDHEQAYSSLGVVPPQPETADSEAAAETVPGDSSTENTPSTNAYDIKEHRSFCAISLNPVLMAISWEEMEQATSDVIKRFTDSGRRSVLVDVSRLEIINSGLVAALVRIWKATKELKGDFTLVSPNEMVSGVLKSAGLWKMWNVVTDRDEAVFGIGASTTSFTGATHVSKPPATIAAAVCAVVAVIAIGVMLFSSNPAMAANAQLLGLLFAAGAVTTGFIGVMRDTGVRRVIAGLSLLVAVGIVSSAAFPGSPIGFERLQQVADDARNESVQDDEILQPQQLPLTETKSTQATVTPSTNTIDESQDTTEPVDEEI